MKLSPDLLTKFCISDVIDESMVEEIALSIKENGQMHPVTVQRLNGEYQVITGRKRVLAAKKLGVDVECTVTEGELDQNAIENIFLQENLKRSNMPWYERALMVAKLHDLQQRIHGAPTNPKGGGRSAGKAGLKTGWSIRDTQKLLDQSLGSVAVDLQLARAIQSNPSLSKVKDRNTAYRLVRIETQRIEAEQQAGAAIIEGFRLNQAFNDDSANVLSQIPEHVFHICCTDPPWLKFYDKRLRIDERTAPVFKELWRVMRWDSFLYVFCGLDDFYYYAGHPKIDKDGNPVFDDDGVVVHENGLLENIGWKVSKTPLIWIKLKTLSRRGVAQWEHGRNYEVIVQAVKGTPVLSQSTQIDSTFSFDVVPPVKMIHPNEKPRDLIRSILRHSGFEGNHVIDPFAGSFVTAEAAIKENMKWVAIERDRETYVKGCKRIKVEV